MSGQIMPYVTIACERLLMQTNHTHIGIAHQTNDWCFFTITCCYRKGVTVFAIALAAAESIKY